MDLEEWLAGVNLPPLREFADEMPGVHEAPRKKCVAFILADPQARERAERSMRIERAALAGRSR